jgi:hypothetical protein
MGFQPLVKTTPGQAHSASNLAIYSCEGFQNCGEGFSAPRFHGVLSTSASSVSAFVGYYHNAGAMDTMKIQLRGFSSDDVLQAQSAFVTVTEDQPLTQITATAPSATIDYFEIVADMPGDEGKGMAIDDLTIVTPDTAPPPNFTLNNGEQVVDVLTGTSVDVPVDMNRINGSNGDVTFSVSGLPAGMTASFNPNPVTGTSTTTTMTLSAATGAAHSDQYTEITVTATPGRGAGPTPRTIKKLVRIRENCDRTVRFSYVDARSNGCLVRNGSKHEGTNIELRVNGLVIKPADDSLPTIVIDDQAKTIKGERLTMPFTVSIDSNPDIPIYAGPIDWNFGGTGNGPRKVVHYDGSKIKKLKGLPVTGLDVSFLQSGKSQITPTVNLNFWPFNSLFGGITTNTGFTTDNDHGADFSGLDLKIGHVNAVALELSDVELHWHQGDQGESWAGGAKVKLKFAKSYTIGAGFGIKNGKFDFLRGSISGLNTSIGAGVFLQSIGFEVRVNPLVLAGSVGLSGGPSVAGVKAVTVNGTLKATFADPFVIEVNGGVKVVNRFDVAQAFLKYSSTGLFQFGGKVSFSFWDLHLNGSVDGWVDGFQAFNIDGSIRACLSIWGPDPCGDARVVLSSKGVGGCVGVFGYHVGAGTTWRPFDPDAFTGCDLKPFSEVKPQKLRAPRRGKVEAAAVGHRFKLPRGLRSVAWEVVGNGTVPGPGVTATGPRGETVTVSPEAPLVQTKRFRAQLLDDGTTMVLVNKPAAGVWTITGDGRVPITKIREARGLPNPSIRAKVTGRGRSRVLSWKLGTLAGQRVTLAEIGKGVRNAIVTGATRSGSVHFRPATGPAGTRRIVALVEQDGLPRMTLTVGSYRAPGPLKPGKPRSLKVKRSGTRLVVSWRAHPAGFRHAVYLKLSDGRSLLQVVAARRRSLTVKGIGRRVGAKLKVRDLTAANGKGPVASVSIRAARR